MIYADEAFYQNEYLLGRKPVISAGLPFYVRQASQMIDQYTFGRLDGLPAAPEAVKMCCCELAEVIFQQEKQIRQAAGKTSEKVGSYSVSFASAQDTALAAAKEQRDVIMKWLADTGLCYRGTN